MIQSIFYRTLERIEIVNPHVIVKTILVSKLFKLLYQRYLALYRILFRAQLNILDEAFSENKMVTIFEKKTNAFLDLHKNFCAFAENF